MKDDNQMQNPLKQSNLQFNLPDFPAIKPEHVLPALNELLQTYQEGIESWLEQGQGSGWRMVEQEVVPDLRRKFS